VSIGVRTNRQSRNFFPSGFHLVSIWIEILRCGLGVERFEQQGFEGSLRRASGRAYNEWHFDEPYFRVAIPWEAAGNR
jgi:hypothetical protein